MTSKGFSFPFNPPPPIETRIQKLYNHADYTNLVDILDNGELGKSCHRVDFAVGVTVITNNKTGYVNHFRKLHVTSKEQNFLLTNLTKTKPCLGCVPGQLALKPELKFEFDKINNC